VEGGKKYRCNICGTVNVCPAYYFNHIDNNGERVDKDSRVELSCGTFDIVAGNDYMSRPPMPPIYFFMIDVSQKSVETGVLEIISNILTEMINEGQFWGDTRTRVGFVFYDSNVHIMDLSPHLKNPKIVTLTDIEHLSKLPIAENLLVNLTDSKTVIL
jgi:protein transport protein SEC24